MKNHDQFHCPVCGTKFDTELELKQHQRQRHTQESVSGATIDDKDNQSNAAEPSNRKNREFTRRHME